MKWFDLLLIEDIFVFKWCLSLWLVFLESFTDYIKYVPINF